jgi:fimbrial chaperone protein
VSRSPLPSFLACLGLALLPTGARAGLYKVTPIRIDLSPGQKSEVLALRSSDASTLRFQVTTFEWQQDPKGEPTLVPTPDIVVFPSIVTIPAGETHNLRVGTTASFGDIEKSYRVFIAEIPPVKHGAEESGLKILTRMGIPVFLQPSKVVKGIRVDGLAVNKGRLSAHVVNTGNVHFLIRNIRLTGRGSDGKTRFEKEIKGWYVLGGGVRDYDLELPKECSQSTELEMQLDIDPPDVKAQAKIPIQGAACAP